MRDNLRQYRARRKALTQGYPVEPRGRLAQHLVPLAALISGIVASKSTQLPQVAANVPMHAAREPRQTICQVVATTTSWKRRIFYHMQTACCGMEPCRLGARHGWQRRGPRGIA